MTPLTHIERHIFDAALGGEPVRHPTMADAAKYEVDARRMASVPLPHVAGGVSARQITGNNSSRLPSESRADVCGTDACGSDRCVDVSSLKLAADLEYGSAAFFARNVVILLALIAACAAAEVFAVWWVVG